MNFNLDTARMSRSNPPVHPVGISGGHSRGIFFDLTRCQRTSGDFRGGDFPPSPFPPSPFSYQVVSAYKLSVMVCVPDSDDVVGIVILALIPELAAAATKFTLVADCDAEPTVETLEV